MDWIAAKLGRAVTPHDVRSILESLEFRVTETAPGHFSVVVPSWRATKDVSIKDDLLEEVGRMLGYGSITPQAPLIESVVPPQNPMRLYQRRVRNMAAAQGFTEVSNYSFISEDMARAFQFPPEAHIRVANPIASDQTLMRLSLLPGIHKNILENSRRLTSFRLFEIGREIHPTREQLPEEIPHFAAAIYARDGDGSANLFELKRLAECLMPDCEASTAAARPFEHPERAATVSWRNRRYRPPIRAAPIAWSRRPRRNPGSGPGDSPATRHPRTALPAVTPIPDQRIRPVSSSVPTRTSRQHRTSP